MTRRTADLDLASFAVSALALLAALFWCGGAGAQPSSAYADDDIWMIENATQDSLENARTNQATVWQNPDTGSSGSITPVETYQDADGRYCREYQKTVTIGGERQQAYGTACRMPDGSWQIARSETVVHTPPPAPTVIYRERVVHAPPPPPPAYYGYPATFPVALNLAFGYYGGDGVYVRGGYGGGYWRGHRGGYWRGYRRGHWRGHRHGHRGRHPGHHRWRH